MALDFCTGGLARISIGRTNNDWAEVHAGLLALLTALTTSAPDGLRNDACAMLEAVTVADPPPSTSGFWLVQRQEGDGWHMVCAAREAYARTCFDDLAALAQPYRLVSPLGEVVAYTTVEHKSP